MASIPEITVIGPGPKGTEVVEILGETFARKNGTYYRICGKCGGAGYLPGYEFSDNARCWQCGTACLDHVFGPVEKAVATARRRITTRKREAAKYAKLNEEARQLRVVEGPKWRAANGDLIVFADSINDTRDLDYEIARMVEAIRGGGYLDESDTKSIRRHIEREAEKVKKAAASGWIGTVGERIELTVEIVKIIEIDDYYSYRAGATKPLYILRDIATGYELVWFASSWGSFAIGEERYADEGDVVSIKAKVKAHRVSDQDFNKGLRQTVVTHVKSV